MSKRLANRRENKPRKAAFVPRALLACAGAGAGLGVIPVCVAGMAGCDSVRPHVDPAFIDSLDDASVSSGYDGSDDGSGDVDAPDASPGFKFVLPDAASDAGPSGDAAMPDDAASDVVSPEPPDAELDGAKDASGVDP
jgi:hypothetical protein